MLLNLFFYLGFSSCLRLTAIALYLSQLIDAYIKKFTKVLLLIIQSFHRFYTEQNLNLFYCLKCKRLTYFKQVLIRVNHKVSRKTLPFIQQNCINNKLNNLFKKKPQKFLSLNLKLRKIFFLPLFEYCSIENLKREIRIQRKLYHPNITQLYHYFEDKDRVYLILEYAEHGSLFQYLRRRGRLSEDEAMKFFKQTCLGIQYLHQQDIIHRDLKPENILLDIQDNVKICDFGWSAENLGSVKRNTFCGTIDYMAPEMIEDKPHDYSLDIWCLGVLLYELLHGQAPFDGKNDIEKCQNIVKVQYQIDGSLTKEAKDLIKSLITYNQQDRLSLSLILNHKWFKLYSQNHSNQMKHGRNKTYNAYSIHSQSQFINKSTASSQSSVIRNHVTTNETQNDTSIEMNFQRFSRSSDLQRKQIRSQTSQSIENESFMHKILVALGCVKREQTQNRNY